MEVYHFFLACPRKSLTGPGKAFENCGRWFDLDGLPWALKKRRDGDKQDARRRPGFAYSLTAGVRKRAVGLMPTVGPRRR